MDKENAYWYMKLVCILVHTNAYWYMKLIPCTVLPTPFEGIHSLIRIGLDWMSNEGGFVARSVHISKQ